MRDLEAAQTSSNPPPGSDAPAAVARGPLALEIVCDETSSGAVVRISPPPSGAPAKIEQALPADVICVIDVSGSMGSSATVQDEHGNTETHGLSVLDVVKHATATVGAMLQPRDRLAIVTFSSRANVALPLTFMDAPGKAALKQTLEGLHPSGSTNLWDGLQHAMDMVDATSAARSTSILLLTDGQPTEEPPRGHVPTLVRYLTKFATGSLPFVVSTVGFGYSLNSQLLRQIADKTGGTYVFIPDSGLVGTVFLNLIANVQATVAVGLQLTVKSTPMAPFEAVHPLLENVKESSTARGLIGSIQFGQTRDVFVQLPKAASGSEDLATMLSATLVYRYEGREFTVSTTTRPRRSQSEDDAKIIVNAKATSLFSSRVEALSAASQVTALDTELSAFRPSTPFIESLRKDVSGQVAMALDQQFFGKWGKHFIPSIVRANMLQQCNNFKDFSVQHFGGELFHLLRDQGEVSFLKLPPPTPSNTFELQQRGGAAAAPVSMAAYYNYSGGCVTADSLVSLTNGQAVAASEVRRGMVLAPHAATVKCVVKIRAPPQGIVITRFPWSRLAITEYHPIAHPLTGEWCFPITCPGASSTLETGHACVYTFVLEGGPAATIDGVDVVALGHGLQTNDAVRHEYLGSDMILKDLAALHGYHADGVVVVDGFLRDEKSRRVNGIVAAADVLIAAP